MFNDVVMMHHKYFGDVWIREGTLDRFIFNDVIKCYSCLELWDRRVLDVGGHIGGFSMYAVMHGAKHVFAYEPDEVNYKLFRKNTEQFGNKISPNRVAIVSHHNPTTSFYRTTSGKNPANYSTLHFNGRKEVTVPAENLHTVLDLFRPTVIKMDCEGAEFELLEKPLPSFVKQIVVEIHFNKREFRQGVKEFIARFKDWQVVVYPKYTPKSWVTFGCWKR